MEVDRVSDLELVEGFGSGEHEARFEEEGGLGGGDWLGHFKERRQKKEERGEEEEKK